MRIQRIALFLLLCQGGLAGAQTWDLGDHLLADGSSRFSRSISLEWSLVDEPDKILVGILNEDPTMPDFRDNPNQDLFKFKISIKPGRWYWSPAEFTAAYGVVTDSNVTAQLQVGDNTPAKKYQINTATDPLLNRTDKLGYLAWADKGSWPKRFLKAIEVSLGFSERPRFLGSVMIPADFLNDDETEFVYELKFNPDELFVRPKDLTAAYKSLESHAKLHPLAPLNLSPLAGGLAACGAKDPVQCIRHTLPDHSIHGGWLAALLPTIKIKNVDLFDFATTGGNFFPITDEDTLTLTVTWDLAGSLDGARNQREAVKALALHQKLVDRENHQRCILDIVPTPLIRVPVNQPASVQLRAQYPPRAGVCPKTPPAAAPVKPISPKGSVKWTLKTVLPANLQGVIQLTSAGILRVHSGNPIPQTPLDVEARDGLGKTATAQVKVEVY